MTIRTRLVYSNGVLTPTAPLSLREGEEVDAEILTAELQEEYLSDEEMKRRFPNSWGVWADGTAEEARQAIHDMKWNSDGTPR